MTSDDGQPPRPGADDDLDAWMAAHFPPPQNSDDDDAVTAGTTDGPVAGTAAGAGVASEGPKGTSPFGSSAGVETPISAGSIGGAGPIGEGIESAESSSNVTESAVDDLFGDTRFRDYENPPDSTADVTAATTVLGSSGVWGSSESLAGAYTQQSSEALTVAVARIRPRPEGMSRLQVVLLWVGGSLVAVLALVALFLIGTRVPGLLGPAPAVLASSTPTPTPTSTERPVGPVAAGKHAWDELLGGECVNPYTGPWAEQFTVVDCATNHAAQLVTRGTFPSGGAQQALYPGADALQARINLLCTAPTVIDYAVAGKYSDIQFAASFAATPQQWTAGQHDYYCFVSRGSGDPITGTLAIPPAPKPSPLP